MTRREFIAAVAAGAALRASEANPDHPRVPAYESLRKYIQPGFDEFPEEKTAVEIRTKLREAFTSAQITDVRGFSPFPASYRAIAPDLREAVYDRSDNAVAQGWTKWVRSLGEARRVQFYPLADNVVRFEVATGHEYRVGHWKQVWDSGKLISFEPIEEHVASAAEPFFRDVTGTVFEKDPAFSAQLARGVPYWRSRLDPASGIDIYGSNGVSVGDIDGDGLDELYVCQPGGLPNRLYKFEADGRAIDVTEKWGVGILDDSSCALFLDLRNSGRQDLVVLRASGPLLFLNEGERYAIRTDAFQSAAPPKGAFTGMAAADFDRDGKLDLYLCTYVYFQSEAQYTYATPYHDAQNGPPNYLFRNRLNSDGSGFFVDCTEETGINENNNRFSFAPAWCDYNDDGWPDLYVANDFGRKNLYVNQNGKFRDLAKEAGVEDMGPGMSASWFDYDSDGRPDVYVANMWTAPGQRVIQNKSFGPLKNGVAADSYRRHTKGNSLYRHSDGEKFADVTFEQGVAFGRWAWASGGHDFDNDGHAEIFVTCGMLTNESETDLDSFFWRQVVAKAPVDATRSPEYENGWNALNQFVREEYSWNGHEPNVLHVRRGGRYFDFSGVSGLDFAEDGRAFAVADFDDDGRPDIFLKSRLGPQLRVLQNNCAGSRASIAFRLQGTKSNRDAIGARVEVDGQVKWLEAGSGFLSQHSKRLIFGLADAKQVKAVRVKWPSGRLQEFRNLNCGHTYSIVEGMDEPEAKPFRAAQRLPSLPLKVDNSLRLEDTWFLQPVPLPEAKTGPALFVLRESSQKYEIFRRYLFDWRTSLKTPFAMLLNKDGHVVKVYGEVPSEQKYRADLEKISNPPALPFAGDYVKQPHRDFFKFGAAYLWAGFNQEALPYLEAALEQSPANARVLLLVAQIHDEANRIPEATKSYRAALDADPKLAEAANGLGLTLAKQGNLDEARKYFEQAISLRRNYADAINNLGVLYTQQGKINDAIAAFEYGTRVAPDVDILYLNLGRTYVQLGQTEKARLVMQQLLDRKPDNATARHALQELNNR